MTLQLSIASATLKLGIQGHHGNTMKSRTEARTTRSQALPAAPARMSEPHQSSARRASFRRRKAAAIRGIAKRPQAIPGFSESWNERRRGTMTVVIRRG